ncbi:MAG TPA: hypothetical protein VHA78_04110 [Candidatus Peribacteraceae bacterium]|nr:hypothetical protein [Candidatus Peribacteraceae bacterium]
MLLEIFTSLFWKGSLMRRIFACLVVLFVSSAALAEDDGALQEKIRLLEAKLHDANLREAELIGELLGEAQEETEPTLRRKKVHLALATLNGPHCGEGDAATQAAALKHVLLRTLFPGYDDLIKDQDPKERTSIDILVRANCKIDITWYALDLFDRGLRGAAFSRRLDDLEALADAIDVQLPHGEWQRIRALMKKK